jgi:hypothetical protein
MAPEPGGVRVSVAPPLMLKVPQPLVPAALGVFVIMMLTPDPVTVLPPDKAKPPPLKV